MKYIKKNSHGNGQPTEKQLISLSAWNTIEFIKIYYQCEKKIVIS